VHEAVGQEELRLGVVELLLCAEGEDVLLGEATKEVLRRPAVGFRGGPPVVVEAHAELREARPDLLVVVVDDGLRIGVFLAGAQKDGHAHFVGAADKDHVAPLQALVAAKEVGRQVGPGQVADVDRAVGVGERGGDEQAVGIRHGRDGSSIRLPRSAKLSRSGNGGG
jgi:hypothetical protein